MNFPTVPTSDIRANGQMNPEWINFFSQMWIFMQQNFSDVGYKPLSYTTAEIALLTDAPNGTIVYNTTTTKAMIKENGSFANIV